MIGIGKILKTEASARAPKSTMAEACRGGNENPANPKSYEMIPGELLLHHVPVTYKV